MNLKNFQERRKFIKEILKNVEPAYIPKEFIEYVKIETEDGEVLVLNPEEFEDYIMREIQKYSSDFDEKEEVIGFNISIKIEEIERLLDIYSKEIRSIFN